MTPFAQRSYHKDGSSVQGPCFRRFLMGSFGENLRREREMRGITLAELSQTTRISVRQLEAIETGRYERLPGGVFNRSFVRQYARYLGLDEDRVVAEFEASAGGPEPVDPRKFAAAAASASLRDSIGPPPGTHRYTRLVVVALLTAAVLSVAAWRIAVKFWPAQEAPAIRMAPPVTASPVATPPIQASPSTAPAQAPAESPAPPAAAPETAAPAASEPPDKTLHLKLEALDRCWVAVYSDGRKQWEGVLQAGETRTTVSARSVQVRVGDAKALMLTLNGETLPPLGAKGEVKTFTYTVEDLAKRSSRRNPR